MTNKQESCKWKSHFNKPKAQEIYRITGYYFQQLSCQEYNNKDINLNLAISNFLGNGCTRKALQIIDNNMDNLKSNANVKSYKCKIRCTNFTEFIVLLEKGTNPNTRLVCAQWRNLSDKLTQSGRVAANMLLKRYGQNHVFPLKEHKEKKEAMIKMKEEYKSCRIITNISHLTVKELSPLQILQTIITKIVWKDCHNYKYFNNMSCKNSPAVRIEIQLCECNFRNSIANSESLFTTSSRSLEMGKIIWKWAAVDTPSQCVQSFANATTYF